MHVCVCGRMHAVSEPKRGRGRPKKTVETKTAKSNGTGISRKTGETETETEGEELKIFSCTLSASDAHHRNCKKIVWRKW